MITKGVMQEAKIAVSYVLKHFYTRRTPKSENDVRVRVFSQIYDFDLINYLHMWFLVNGDITGATADLYIYADEVLQDSVLNMSDKQEEWIFLDCTSLTGTQTLEIHLQSGAAGEEAFLEYLSIYPISKELGVPL